MTEKRVSKKQATNQKTGRLKKGYKAKGKGVYVQVTATKPKRKATKRKTTKSFGLTRKIKKALKK